MGKRDSSLVRSQCLTTFLKQIRPVSRGSPRSWAYRTAPVILDSEGPGLSQRGRGGRRNQALTHRVAY